MSGLVFFLEFLWLIWRYIADTFWNFLIPWLLNYLSQCTLTLPVPSQWEPEKPIVLAAFITENLEIYCLLFIRKTNFVTCWAWMVYGQGKNKWKMRGCIDSRAWFCMRQLAFWNFNCYHPRSNTLHWYILHSGRHCIDLYSSWQLSANTYYLGWPIPVGYFNLIRKPACEQQQGNFLGLKFDNWTGKPFAQSARVDWLSLFVNIRKLCFPQLL